MVTTKKFSEFTNAGDLENDNITVGLEGGANARFNNPWTFLAPGSTASRPVIESSMYNRLRLNTDNDTYEYYDPIDAVWKTLNTTPGPVYPITLTVVAATTPATNLNATYVNGAAGVGATLTSNSNGALVLDGFAVSAGNILLLKDSPNDGLGNTQGANGIYTVTVVGTAGTPFILTRSTAWDQPNEFVVGQVFAVTNGSVNAGTQWILTNAPTAISDNGNAADYISFAQYSPALQGYVNLIGNQTVYGVKSFVDPLVAESLLATPMVVFNDPASINQLTANALISLVFGDLLISSNIPNSVSVISGNELALGSAAGTDVALQPGTGGFVNINATVGVNAIIDDNTFATATQTNLPTAASVKAYVDSQVAGNPVLNLIYVSPNGSDASGNGTSILPYATYEFARNSVVATASETNPFVIYMLGYFTITGNMILSPFVHIYGTNNEASVMVLTGQVILDASFGTKTNPFTHISNIGLEAAGNINLTFPSYQNSTVHFDNVDFRTTPQINVVGSGTNATPELVLIENCISLAFQPPISFTNINGAIVDGNMNGVTAINSSAITNNFLILNNIIAQTGNVTFRTTSTGIQVALILAACLAGATLTLDGTLSTVNIDASSYQATPVFLNSATITQLVPLSNSDGELANVNFTPVNYTPVGDTTFLAASVTGNLKGIDAALAVSGSGTVHPGLVNEIGYYATTSSEISGLTGGNGTVLVTNNTGVPSMLANPAASGKALLSVNGDAPAWSTPTYPSASGTAGKILRSDATNNVYSTSTFADTYSASNLLYSNGANTVTGLATTNRASLSTNATGVPTWLGLTDGQVVIGSTAGAPAASTLTAGTGISITSASNSITINATGGGFAVVSIAGTTQAAAVNTTYIAQNAGQTTVTLPATYAVGDTVSLIGSTANTGGWILTASTGDTVRVNNGATSAGGTVTSAAIAGQCIEVVCDVANTSWVMRTNVSTILTTA